MIADSNDIFYKPSCSKDWKDLYSDNYLEVVRNSSKSFEKKYAELEQDMLTLTAAVSKGIDSDGLSLGNVVKTGFNAVFYKIFSSKRKKQAELFLSDPNPQKAAEMLNLLDSKYTKTLLKLIMPSINVNKRIYVPKALPRLTLENLFDERDYSKYLLEKPKAYDNVENLLDFNPDSRTGNLGGAPTMETYITQKLKPLPRKVAPAQDSQCRL